LRCDAAHRQRANQLEGEEVEGASRCRSGDPDYLIFVGLDRFGECFLAAFSTIGDPLEFRARHEKQLDRAAQGLLPIGLLPRDDGGIISSSS